MKIKLSENETYEITVKEEISCNELKSLITKLNKVSSLIDNSKSPLKNKEENDGDRRRNNRGIYDFTKSREGGINFLKLHYFGSRLAKEDYAAKYGVLWAKLAKRVGYTKQRWNIAPEEIGLERFPTRRGDNIRTLKRPQAEYLEENEEENEND